MNRWRIAGLVLLAIFASWFALRSCAPAPPPAPSEPAPPREHFHAAKALSVRVSYADAAAASDDLDWLQRELRYLLIHGQMRVAPVDASAYALQIELTQALPSQATLKLVAPGGTVERTQSIELQQQPLAVLRELATVLPEFLGAAPARNDWLSLLGTEDADAYQDYLRSSNEVLGRQGQGFVRPRLAEGSPTIDRLETLTQRHPRFARAWGLLSIAYLSLGGKDESSLTQLADAAAERALALDATLTDAQAAEGLVHLRRSEWSAALEQFEKTLTVDANAAAALEGLACLLVDVGHDAAALPIARRAVAVQPGNAGARECLIYAELAGGLDPTAAATTSLPMAAKQVIAMNAMLKGEHALARSVLSAQGSTQPAWIASWLNAATDERKTSQALQAVTAAASEQAIDPVTEVVCGAGLRQADFVFNRLSRLHKQNQPLPLRVLWLPQTRYLREHQRFEEIVTTAALSPFWQDHGAPDACSTEPDTYGCSIKNKGQKSD